MRIAAIQFARVRFASPGAASARSAWPERRSLIVRAIDDEGTRGHGEASPLPGYSPDTFEEAERALRAAAAALPLETDDCLPAAPQIRRLLRPLPIDAPSARFALETALLDLAGRRVGASIAALLSGGAPRRALEINALVPPPLGAQAVARAERLAAQGFRTFKIKIGAPGQWEDELFALASLRAALGPSARLRVDVNGGWTPAEARRRLAELAILDLEFVEQPVGPDDLLHFAGADVPLAADESLRIPDALARLADAGACRVAVLKPAVLGGFFRCLELAREAATYEMRTVVTSIFDGPLARAAAAQLAFALDPPPLACGLSPADGSAPRPSWPPAEKAGLGLAPPPELFP